VKKRIPAIVPVSPGDLETLVDDVISSGVNVWVIDSAGSSEAVDRSSALYGPESPEHVDSPASYRSFSIRAFVRRRAWPGLGLVGCPALERAFLEPDSCVGVALSGRSWSPADVLRVLRVCVRDEVFLLPLDLATLFQGEGCIWRTPRHRQLRLRA
jgi:hypothetical protein